VAGISRHAPRAVRGAPFDYRAISGAIAQVNAIGRLRHAERACYLIAGGTLLK
jgi:hypothetical protein